MSTEADKPAVPEWSRLPFHRFLDFVQEESKLAWLASSGIQRLVGEENLAEALAKLDLIRGGDEEEAQSNIARAREQAAMAREEVARDFRLLHGHSLVGVWGALETLVEEVAIAWLMNRPSLLKSEHFAAIRVPVAEFHTLRRRERVEYIVDSTFRRSGVAAGMPRFEEILSTVGLGRGIDADLRRLMMEAHQVRNAFAHRAGLADVKLLRACPWRKEWRVGMPVPLGRQQYREYFEAIEEYVVELMDRTGQKFGVSVRELPQPATPTD